MDEQCAEALNWGMPYELFWKGRLDALYIYQDKFLIEQKRRNKEIDFKAWSNGLYTQKALQSVYHLFNPLLPKGTKGANYPDKPILIKHEQEVKKEKDLKKLEETKQAIIEHNLLIQIMKDSKKKK